MAAPLAVNRVLVHATKSSLGAFTKIEFTQSLVDFLQDGNPKMQDETQACARMNGDHLLLLPPECASSTDDVAKLKRPEFCPIHNLDSSQRKDIPPEILSRGVDCGAVVLVESSDGKVLLIRRPKNLRTFPGIWVPPGGHVEVGETIPEAGLRELKEETGLDISKDMCQNGKISILAMWESVYPPLLAMGLPKRHHLVLYLHIKLTSAYNASYMTELLKPCPREVMACAWMERPLIQAIVSVKEGRDVDETCKNAPATISGFLMKEGGVMEAVALSTAGLLGKATGDAEDTERVSTGTKYALEQWLALT